jgi:UMF1 family MFS transporter
MRNTVAMTDASTTTIAADESRVPRKQVFSWALWDWATQPFNTVIVTFVFVTLYLTSDDFIDPATVAELGYDKAVAQLVTWVGLGSTIAGLAVAVVAPVLGQIADRTGRRKAWLGWATVLLVACMLALFFVEAAPEYFLWGAIIVALAAIISEIAGVNYNAMVVQVSTPRTMGRVSGLGWGLGYVGGIVALVIVVVLDGADWFGLDTSNGMAYRLIAVGCAVWTLIFAWPLFVWVPEPPASPIGEPIRIRRAYVVLWHNVRELWREARPTVWFLIASAVYRDGLAGVFTFGAIIASKAYGFEDAEVIMFGIAANLIAGVSTVIAGRLDDRVGPRLVILWALGIIIAAGLAVAFLHGLGTITFWVCGLILSAMVGPAQASSRSLLARLAPQGREAEIFGLYATTGRAASFMSQGMWTFVIWLTGATLWGTLGIISIVVLGFVLLLFVRTPADRGAAAHPVLSE